VKITVTGVDLSTPITITDESILAGFNIWSGPGNYPIVRDGSVLWSKGYVSERPKRLPRYEVSFYGTFPDERVMYVVMYEYDPAARKGYLYLPGPGEPWYEVNVRSIYRNVEGHWFHVSPEFDRALNPIIRSAKLGPGDSHR
jgi:hypothetical protein